MVDRALAVLATAMAANVFFIVEAAYNGYAWVTLENPLNLYGMLACSLVFVPLTIAISIIAYGYASKKAYMRELESKLNSTTEDST